MKKSSIETIARFNHDQNVNGGQSLERYEHKFFNWANEHLSKDQKQAYYKFILLSRFNIYIP